MQSGGGATIAGERGEQEEEEEGRDGISLGSAAPQYVSVSRWKHRPVTVHNNTSVSETNAAVAHSSGPARHAGSSSSFAPSPPVNAASACSETTAAAPARTTTRDVP